MRKNFLAVTTVVTLLCGFNLSSFNICVANDKDTQNAVVAHHKQNRSFTNKAIGFEKYRQQQQEESIVTKTLKKRLARISWMQHNKISEVVIKGNKSIDTKEIYSVIKPYLHKRLSNRQIEKASSIKDVDYHNIVTKKGKIKEAYAVFRPGFNKGVDRRDLDRISIALEDYYHKQGYFLPVAHAEIVGSKLNIRIVEGKIKKVFVVLADQKKDKKVLTNHLVVNLLKKITQDSPTKINNLAKYIELINNIPGYRADYEFELLPRVEGNNVTNLVMYIETKRGTAEISVGNKGIKDTGKYEFNATAQAFNLLSNDVFMLQAGTTDKPKRSKIITGSYFKQLNSFGTAAGVIIAHLGYDPYSKNGSKDSITKVYKGQIDQYLFLNHDHSVKLELGAEKRDTKRYSQTDKLSDYNYSMGTIGAHIKLSDTLNGENFFFPYFNWTLNSVSYKQNSTQNIDFDKSFSFFLINWYREQMLPRNFSLFLKASYQNTDKKLPTEHLYSIGTDHTARGYKAGLVSSDEGITGSIEMRYSREIENGKMQKFLRTAQIFGFYDVTHFIRHNKDATRKEHDNLAYFNKSTLPAIGAGLRLSLFWDIYAEGVAEFPIAKNIMIDGAKHKNQPLYRFWLSKEFNW